MYTVTELCERYAISRKTGYKWLDRFDEAGRPGLRDRSRAPHQ
ncbi:MAG TPA: helix-turn-helix domain-containing protein, partial [Methylomirabilota bacterium]|nr:helix-turn-helix domain-containing protein [Methylomirabilota bacterium]